MRRRNRKKKIVAAKDTGSHALPIDASTLSESRSDEEEERVRSWRAIRATIGKGRPDDFDDCLL